MKIFLPAENGQAALIRRITLALVIFTLLLTVLTFLSRAPIVRELHRDIDGNTRAITAVRRDLSRTQDALDAESARSRARYESLRVQIIELRARVRSTP